MKTIKVILRSGQELEIKIPDDKNIELEFNEKTRTPMFMFSYTSANGAIAADSVVAIFPVVKEEEVV